MTSHGAEQIVHEYQIFREVFSRVAESRGLSFSRAERGIVNASIDHAVREAVKEFSAMHGTMRQRVAASLSHDMRNPLSVIVNGAQVLTLGTSAEKGRGLAGRILDSGRRLGEMIEELLDVLSSQQGKTDQLGEFLVVASDDGQAKAKVKRYLQARGMPEAAGAQVYTVDVGNARIAELDTIY
jgi:signal transduction histidine kinase